MIEVEGVSKAVGSVQALAGVSLHAQAGRVLGLLGPNGAGKTTLVRILTTLLRPDSGHARVAGLDIVRDAVALRSAIGLAGQYAAVDEMLTGRENLQLVGQLYHLGRAERRQRAGRVLEQFQLADAADRPVRTYSGGMRRRLDLAASLVGQPPVLILDEPTTGLVAVGTTAGFRFHAGPAAGGRACVGARLRVRVLPGVRHHRPGDHESGGRAIRRALRLFMLVFASSAFVPVPALPGWL